MKLHFFKETRVLLFIKVHFVIYSISTALELGIVYCHASVFHYYKLIFPFFNNQTKTCTTYINNILYIVSTPTCFDAPASS